MKVSKGFLGKLSGEHSRVHLKRTRPFVLAVMGTGRGVGTTHFCIAVLNFLVNVRGMKAVMSELNMHPVMCQMKNSGEEIMTEFIKPFESVRMAGGSHDVIILDISADYPRGINEFMRSDIRFLIGSLSLWKADELADMLDKLDKYDAGLNDSLTCLSLAYNKQAAGRIKKAYGIDTQAMPFIENPLVLSPAHCVRLNEMLENIWKD